ncbi:MAG TPA: hypothetical protein VI702_04385, partial [Nitrospiria bacterium]
MFFEEQGMPILKMALKRMLFDEALPDPFSVATQIFRSLILTGSIVYCCIFSFVEATSLYHSGWKKQGICGVTRVCTAR